MNLIAVAIVAGISALALVAPANAQTTSPVAAQTPSADVEAATAFARKLTGDATAALTSAKPKAEQLADFQKVLGDGLALDVIGKFMIGETRKRMTPAQVTRYDAAFPPYLTKLYADQFAQIVGRPLEVVDAKALGRDVIVRTRFSRKEGAPINVDWRVRALKSGERKAVDIIVSGVSIMLVKREEFSAFVAQSGVDALIGRIEQEGKA
ncbi:MAG: ABC transporter substrate-binding protein [Parvularculaceae bacterium]|nr:ABC transporter substrate-binding protein [Parvularculaceae bacterium]